MLRAVYKEDPDSVVVVAPTGLAACQIGGVTIHRFAGLTTSHRSVSDVDALRKRIGGFEADNDVHRRWRHVKTLVVDEISMVSGQLFDLLELVARKIRHNEKPFGGIQLLVMGDFFQLPPVQPRGQTAPVSYAFEAESWSRVITHSCVLTKTFRSRDIGKRLLF
jgi:ATP-dependent DNA helicase PIF1